MKIEQDASVDAVFWSQWQEHQDYLYRCCLKHLGNPTDTQDALSEAMLKAWDKIRTTAQPIQNIKAWLMKPTYHHCIDIQRKRGSVTEIGPEAELISQEETPVGAATRRQLQLFFRDENTSSLGTAHCGVQNPLDEQHGAPTWTVIPVKTGIQKSDRPPTQGGFVGAWWLATFPGSSFPGTTSTTWKKKHLPTKITQYLAIQILEQFQRFWRVWMDSGGDSFFDA
jgi:RNA polymerase sigma-70 factor (ECF subfamily)